MLTPVELDRLNTLLDEGYGMSLRGDNLWSSWQKPGMMIPNMSATAMPAPTLHTAEGEYDASDMTMPERPGLGPVFARWTREHGVI